MEKHARDSDLSTEGEEPPAKRRKRTPTFLSSREVGLMRSMPGHKISTFVGSSSGVHFIRSVYSALRAHPDTTVPNSTSGSNIVPGEDDHLLEASPNVPRQLWKSHDISTDGNPLLTFQNLLDWSRSYFAHWHPTYPFLHAPAILTFFETLAQRGDTRDATNSEYDIVILKSISTAHPVIRSNPSWLIMCRNRQCPSLSPTAARALPRAKSRILQKLCFNPTMKQSKAFNTPYRNQSPCNLCRPPLVCSCSSSLCFDSMLHPV